MSDSRRMAMLSARISTVSSLVLLALLFVTAGQYLQDHRFDDLHGLGSIALHVTTGVLAVSVLVHS